MNSSIKVIANIGLLIALYYLTYYFYLGILHPISALGDSFDYHIPISQTILDESFLHLSHTRLPQWYYPGSSEAINSLFILFYIPLTVSNIFATIVLFFCLYKLARCFDLQKYYALLYAVTFITLNAIIRWQNAVSIDVWVAVFFTLALIILEKPKKSIFYFVQLGFVLGMLIGSKYTAIYFIILLLIFYVKQLLPFINVKRSIAFLLPFSVFGLFWYIRNYLLKGNPFYPLPILGFKGPLAFNDSVFNETFHHPLSMLNSFFGEYHLWIVSVLVALAVLIDQFIIKKKFQIAGMSKLFVIGLICFALYLTFPTDAQPWIMVSSLRYSFPTFIPLILGVFILAAKYKQEEFFGHFALANMISIMTMTYYPKLILIY